MDYLDSVRRAVRHYPGGLDAVAVRLGKSGSTLDKELRGATGYKLGAVDAAEIAAMCADVGTPHALDYPTRLAETVGGTLMLLPTQLADECNSVTAQRVADLMREFADVVTATTKADADDEIKLNEMVKIRREWAELVASGQQLMGHLESKHDATMAKWREREGGAA